MIISKKRTILMIGALTLGAAAAAPLNADCTAIRSGTNDFDQVRESGPGILGLPNDGLAYCYPASWTSWMAYLNQQGFPQAMGVPDPVADWSGQAVYNLVTTRIELMGAYCSTSASGGTTGPHGVMDYLGAVGIADHFFFTETEVNWSDPSEIVTPHLTTWDISANMQNSGLVAITIGWSDYDGGVNVGAGAHVVGVAAIIGDMCTGATHLLRDPGAGGDPLSQSPYVFTATTMSNVIGDFQRGSFPTQLKLLPQLDVYGDREAFLVAIFTLYPTNAASIPPTLTHIALHRPWQFDDQSFPELEEFAMPAGMVASDAAIHASGQGLVVIGESGDVGSLLWFGYRDEEFQTVPDIDPDPGPLAVNRFGEVYVVEGNSIKRIALGLDEGMIAPSVMDQAGLEIPLARVAVSDANDMVYGLSTAGPGGFIVYDRSLGFVGTWSLPVGVAIEGEPVFVPAEDTGELWLASAHSGDLYRFAPGPDGAPILAETIMLPGVEGVEALHVFGSRRVVVVEDGSSREFTHSFVGGWYESDETGFAGLNDLYAFDVAMNRSTAPRYDNAEDRPDWPAVLPEDDHTPCPADVDHDGVVSFMDLLVVLANWGPCDLLCPGDATADHLTDFQDLLTVLSQWGPCP